MSRRLQVSACDRITRFDALHRFVICHIQQDAASDKRRDGLNAQRCKTCRGLYLQVNLLSTVEMHLFGLVAQGIDMRTGMFGHIDEARSARSRFIRALLVATVQRID